MENKTSVSNKEFQLWKDGYDLGYMRGQEDAIKHGKWDNSNSIDKNNWFCSVCGHMISCATEIKTPVIAKYCPHCGAQMDLD